jgi:hypothetical protein
MARIILKAENFTQVYLDGSNQFRYRIITDDRNKWSHWSPVVNIKRPGISGEIVADLYNFSKTSTSMSVFWKPTILTSEYDLFVSYNTADDPEFYTRTNNTFIIIPIPPTGANQVEVVVQLASYPIELNSDLEYFTVTQAHP